MAPARTCSCPPSSPPRSKTTPRRRQGNRRVPGELDIGYIDLMLIHAPQPWERLPRRRLRRGQPRRMARPRRGTPGRQDPRDRCLELPRNRTCRTSLDGGTITPTREPAPRPRRQPLPQICSRSARTRASMSRRIRPSRTARSSTTRRPEGDGRQVTTWSVLRAACASATSCSSAPSPCRRPRTLSICARTPRSTSSSPTRTWPCCSGCTNATTATPAISPCTAAASHSLPTCPPPTAIRARHVRSRRPQLPSVERSAIGLPQSARFGLSTWAFVLVNAL